MADDLQSELEQLGLASGEAQVYLALIRNGALGASALASVIDIPRSSVYPTINSLVTKGLVEAGAGYGSRFSAVPAERALRALINREKEELSQRESLAKKLTEKLSLLEEPAESVPEEVIQVIRSPRAVGERFERLQLEAERQIDVFVKAPTFVRPGNPAEEKPLRRGVRCRGLYERKALDIPSIRHGAKWISKGEEARVYDGDLPHKLAIFDRHSVLMTLTMPGDQMRTLFIRHAELANSFGILFDSFWARARPLDIEEERTAESSIEPEVKKDPPSRRISRNGRRSRNREKVERAKK